MIEALAFKRLWAQGPTRSPLTDKIIVGSKKSSYSQLKLDNHHHEALITWIVTQNLTTRNFWTRRPSRTSPVSFSLSWQDERARTRTKFEQAFPAELRRKELRESSIDLNSRRNIQIVITSEGRVHRGQNLAHSLRLDETKTLEQEPTSKKLFRPR